MSIRILSKSTFSCADFCSHYGYLLWRCQSQLLDSNSVNGHMHQGRKYQDLEEYIENASMSKFLFYENFIFRPHCYLQRRIVRYEEHIRCIEDHCLNCMEHVSPSI